MSSSTSDVDYGDDGADRRYLDDGEINGDGEGTIMITTSRRTDLWHKRDQLLPGPSTTPAMAAMTARLRYAGEMKPKTVKQRAWEGPVAHHEHVGAKNETG